jgi:UDP:flavonoid glycosyltransferase YjiC (YdhE family)
VRALFSVRPYYGHFHPMTELGCRLQEDGDEVGFATAGTMTPAVRDAGFVAFDAGVDPRGLDDVTQFGIDPTQAKLDDLLRLASADPPDVIIRDPTDFAALIAAELLHVPVVTFGFSLYIGPWQWKGLVGPTIRELRARHNLAPDPELSRLHPDLYLDCVPPWFQSTVRAPEAIKADIRPFAPPTDVPPAANDDVPTIYLTMGTVYNRDPFLFRLLASALADEPVKVIATVGPDQDPDHILPAHPANFSVHRYIPQAEILPRVAAVVCHGGFSTILGALAHGLPVLAIPVASDQHANAERCRTLGAGVTLARAELSMEGVREGLRHVLHDRELRAAARHLRSLIAALPGPGDAAVRVRSLVTNP